MKRITILLSALCLVIMASAQPLAGENTPPQASIADMQKKLSTVRSEVEQLLETQADIYDQLDKVEAELELSSRLLGELRNQSRNIASEIAATSDTIQILRQQSSQGNVTYALHLRALYKQPQPEDRFIPFGANDGHGGDREYLMQRMIVVDKNRLVTIGSDLTSNEQLLANLRDRQQELATVTVARQAEEQQAEATIAQRDRLLAQVKGQQRQRLRQLAELDQSSQTLGDIFEQIESQRRQTVDAIWQREHELALRLKGRLFRPVRGGTVTGFGLQRRGDDGLWSKSNGIDIATRSGAKVVAAATGEVLYIGWARGLERFVVVDHGGSIYSLYGNLDQVTAVEGDQVIRGEQFATAAGSQVHFEIREGKIAVDPADWLRR